jgi:hypothetical protein
MPTVRVALLTLIAVAACDPEPHYPPVDPIPPGPIEVETGLVTRDDAPVGSVWRPVGQGTVSAPDFYGGTDVTASLEHGGVWSLAYVDRRPTSDGEADAQVD